jgi:hypothetical protein
MIAAWAGAVLALGVLVFAGIGLAQLRVERAGIDKKTLCGAHEPSQIIALLFDSSDQINDLQKIKTRQILDGLLYNIPKGARVDVYMATAEAGQLARPLFSRCNPASADGTAGWSENPQRQQELRRAKFQRPLERALKKALRANPRNTSPILETIAAASVQSFGRVNPAGGAQAGRYHMIIVSDFLQNSALLSQYGAYAGVEKFSTSAGWISTLPRLNNVAVKLIYINRASSRRFQNESHRIWWCEYFAKRGATSCDIEQL